MDANPKPFSVELLLTSQCNLRCKMCDIWRVKEQNQMIYKEELSKEEFIMLFDELCFLGTNRISISGGEPLLRGDVFDIIREAKKNDFYVDMNSNGTLISKSKAIDLVNSGLDNITISLDSPRPEIHDYIRGEEGCWIKTVQGLHNLKEAKERFKVNTPSVTINFLLSRITHPYLENMIELKDILGYDDLNLLLVIRKSQTADELLMTKDDLRSIYSRLDDLKKKVKDAGLPQKLLSPLKYLFEDPEGAIKGFYSESYNKRNICFIPWIMAVIDPFGRVYPCWFACSFYMNTVDGLKYEFRGSDNFCMGDLKENSFKEIWMGQRYAELRKVFQSPPNFSFCKWCNQRTKSRAILTKLIELKKKFGFDF